MTSLQLTAVACAEAVPQGGHYSVYRLNLSPLGTFGLPLLAFECYRLRGRTFSAHPHAGVSIISYVFEDSPGSLRNRDSLHNDFIIDPGSLLWTQASTGLIHDEFPAQQGVAVNGLQVLINLSAEHKALAPCTYHLKSQDIPRLSDADGTEVRVLCGKYLSAQSPVVQAERFDFLEARIFTTWRYTVSPGRNVLIYLLSGELTVSCGDTVRHLTPHQALAGTLADAHATLQFDALVPCHVLVFCGLDPDEPQAIFGPFYMNNQHELSDALERYQNGDMGRITPLRP